MSIDPQNPLFRYIDKAIVALAGLVLLWAVSNAFSSKSPAVDACDTVRDAMESLDKRVKDKRWDGNETGQPQHYAKLSKRFSADSMPEGDRFREAVFYSPDAILGDPMTVKFRPSRPDIYYYMIKDKYAKDFPALAAVNYATAEPAIVKGLNIAELTMDAGRKAVKIVPRKEGSATVRVEFFGGTSFTFLLTTDPQPPEVVPEPEQPLNVAATGHRGYVSLKWNTNPESCPATYYIIYKSDALDKAGVQVLELAVNDREMPPKEPTAIPEPPKAVPQQYEWDDMNVDPGTEYYYTIKTRGLVKREEKEEIETSPASDQVKAMPLDNVALFLTSGMPQSLIANIEVMTWHGYVPRAHAVRAITCGQRVRDRKIATGYTLIDVEQLPRQVMTLKRVFDRGRIVQDDEGKNVMKEVRTINTNAVRAILVDESNQVIEIWGPHRWMRGYEKKIDDEFEKHPKDKWKPLPKIAQERGEVSGAELAVTNNGDTPLTFLARSRKDRVIKDIPPYSTRVFELEQDDYEMLGVYREEKRKDDVSFHKEKVTLRKRTRYELGFKKPKKELPTEPEKPADVDGDGGGPEGE